MVSLEVFIRVLHEKNLTIKEFMFNNLLKDKLQIEYNNIIYTIDESRIKNEKFQISSFKLDYWISFNIGVYSYLDSKGLITFDDKKYSLHDLKNNYYDSRTFQKNFE